MGICGAGIGLMRLKQQDTENQEKVEKEEAGGVGEQGRV